MKGQFKSAYQNYDGKGGHQAYTAYSEDSKRCIDYIMYSGGFKVISLLEMPTNLEDLHPSIPNKHFPSDHMRIEAVFEIWN